ARQLSLGRANSRSSETILAQERILQYSPGFPSPRVSHLDRKWKPKVTGIMESKDVYSMSLATLFGKLQEHEMELERLTLYEQTDKNIQRISFKATKSEQYESSEVNSYDSSSNSDNSPTYDILYSAFVEMHEELEKLAKKYLDKKRLIIEHEKKIYELQSSIDELKLDNETLDLIYANSSCNCTTKLSETSTCENCKVLNAENFVLKNKFAKFTYSSHNLDNLLAASRNVGNRSGLGYMHAMKSTYF
ncbi:hypothetical protein Lal_00024428, partial [Lupinus albus]